MTDDPAERLLRLHHAGRRVLLVDDNPINQDIARDLLGSVRLVVDVATDGCEAVDLVLVRPYDLVLMDVEMPRMDGLAVTRMIRRRLGRRPPIIALTSNARDEDRLACRDAGMDDHVAKPVDPRQLYATVRFWLGAPATPAAAESLPGTDLDG